MQKSSAIKAEAQPLPFEAERNFQTYIWANTLPRDPVIIHPSCYAIPKRFEALTTPVLMME